MSRIHRPTRRQFLGASTAALSLSGASRGAAAPVPVIDTHIHLYDPRRPQGIPWPPPGDPLYLPYLPDQFLDAASPYNVKGAVVVEASDWIEDNQWILDLARRHPVVVAFIGNLPVGTPEFAGHLRRFAADPLFRGIRVKMNTLARLEDEAVQRDLRLLESGGLCIDVLGDASTIAPTVKAATMMPGLRVVFDHFPLAAWDTDLAAMRRALAAVAPLPNVYAKISEVVRKVNGTVIVDPAFYRDRLETLLGLFGPDRVVYCSNWPVSERMAPYEVVHRVAADFFATKSDEVREKFFWRNSRVAYRWVRRGAAASLR